MTKRTKPQRPGSGQRRAEKHVDSEIRRAAKRAKIAEPEPDAEVYRRLLRSLRETTIEALGGTDLVQTIVDLEAVEELLEHRAEGVTPATSAALAYVLHGVTARLHLAMQLRDGMWDPDDPHATMHADTKTLPLREGGAS
jgi:hypothetical protein